jgi:hypothetical protein
VSAGLLAQYLVIALAVAGSLAYVLHAKWPQGVRAARAACAIPLLRAHRAAWARRIGRWIAPAPRMAGEGTCGGCSTGCATPKAH